MDPSNIRFAFRVEDFTDVQKILRTDGALDDAEISRRSCMFARLMTNRYLMKMPAICRMHSKLKTQPLFI